MMSQFILIYLGVMLCIKMSTCNSDYIAPSLFVNHGGGPKPVLGDEYNRAVAESLRNVSEIIDFNRLKAIIVVTAHREEDIVTISSGKKHKLLFDYSTEYSEPPKESFLFKYDADGDPILAQEIHEGFKKAGIPSQLDDQRGWDHGVFIPMMLINPKADIPIVQISILNNQNAEKHFEIGKILYQFRKRGVAIFGSGLSYHNNNELEKDPREELGLVNLEFDKFLNEVCTGDGEKVKEIFSWEDAAGAYDSHPLGGADHLMPLIVNAGAGGSQPGKNVFDGIFGVNFKLSGFMWDGK